MTDATSTSALSIQLSPCSMDNLMASLYNDTKQHAVFFVFTTKASRAKGVDNGDDAKLVSRKKITCQKIGEHKLVLRLWPYFRKMFDSEFAEGGAGERRIRIKDVKSAAFHVLVRFMCASKIPQGEIPAECVPTTRFALIRPISRKCFWQHIVMSSRSCARESSRRSPQD